MKEIKRIWIHLVLLALGAAAAYVTSRPKDATDQPLQAGEVDVWKGRAEDVSRIAFEDDKRRVTLERRSDAAGPWFLGHVEPLDGGKAEAGADNPHATPVEAATFPSVTVMKELSKSLASLRARRSFGVVEESRAKEFGFDKPDGTLRVTVAGVEHALLVGASTVGSATRYVRDLGSNTVYVIDATPVNDMKGGAARLSERSQHEWKWSEPDGIAVEAGGKTKRLVRSGTEGRRFWADAASPDQNDETSGNWLTKLERLRPGAYLENLPEDAKRLVRVEYRIGGEVKGFLELFHRGDKDSPFLAVTENMRLPGTVTRSVAFQVVDDLASVLPGVELPAIPRDEPAAVPPPAPPASTAPAPAPGSAAPAASGAPGATPLKGAPMGKGAPKK